MASSIDHITTAFHNEARMLCNKAEEAFLHSVHLVSRRNEEYRFQELKRQHAHTLEQGLLQAAQELMRQFNNSRIASEANPLLHQLIRDYLHRFIQKINDL